MNLCSFRFNCLCASVCLSGWLLWRMIAWLRSANSFAFGLLDLRSSSNGFGLLRKISMHSSVESHCSQFCLWKNQAHRLNHQSIAATEEYSLIERSSCDFSVSTFNRPFRIYSRARLSGGGISITCVGSPFGCLFFLVRARHFPAVKSSLNTHTNTQTHKHTFWNAEQSAKYKFPFGIGGLSMDAKRCVHIDSHTIK